jgi:hypothetical protein
MKVGLPTFILKGLKCQPAATGKFPEPKILPAGRNLFHLQHET